MYTITTHITPKKKNPLTGIWNAVILVIAIPVVMIAIISLLVYFSLQWLWNLARKKAPDISDQTYHLELPLIENEFVSITMIEDELDTELTTLNDAWTQSVYNQETGLYRAKTNPVIPEIDNKIMAFYLKERPGGAMLQVLKTSFPPGESSLETELIFLSYADLRVSRIGRTGAFYLFNDKKNAELILGINKKEKIRIELVETPR
ncbi:MAG TPA: hypothetical protein VEZ17_05930 [Chitinophagaceae bacterium]|nr:hypothetical protein [Chitinophagaceae bacterium]